MKRKTITIREDQDEWIEDQHLNSRRSSASSWTNSSRNASRMYYAYKYRFKPSDAHREELDRHRDICRQLY
ncbi:helix-turn-helix domain-containing protein, partial [Haladaptatus sp. W1]|uniref:helix-turn-helix domain-containing protein n=1 Tax=Haladaptatus sp. W1 TaxID=1897478 RepID=UPI0020C7FDDB